MSIQTSITIALLAIAGPLLAQNPTPAQGRDYTAGLYRVMRVDSMGRLEVVTSGSAVSCTALSPCVVVGPDAAGSPSTSNPVQFAGVDSMGNVRFALLDTSGRQEVVGASASGAAAAGNPVLQGIRDTSGNAQYVAAINGVAKTGGPGATAGTFGKVLLSGTTWDQDFVCAQQARINVSASGNNEIIAASGSTVIRICAITGSVAGGASLNISFTSGTGTNCGTSNAVVAGSFDATTALWMPFGSQSALRFGAGNAACINLSGATAFQGVVVYAQF